MTKDSPPSAEPLQERDSDRDATRIPLEHSQQPSPPPSDALRAALSAAIDAVIWMSGSDDFSPSGKAHEGWLKVRPRIDQWSALLAAIAAPSAATCARCDQIVADLERLAAPSAGSAGQAAMSISKRDAWAESLKKGAHRCRQHGDNGDAETLDDVRNYLVANACAQAVDQQARRLADEAAELKWNRIVAESIAAVQTTDKSQLKTFLFCDTLALLEEINRRRSLAHPETQEPT